jgi:hypothetical protein
MEVTAKCRYNASIRINRMSKFSFFTTVVISLGLILIPLLQNAGIVLAFSAGVLNMLQIFLAVAVLVYSVINSTAKYETRSERLNECGDRIKELIRDLRVTIKKAGGGDGLKLDDVHTKYSGIVKDSENHSRSDYALAVLQHDAGDHITGFHRLSVFLRAWIPNLVPYTIPSILLMIEFIFILDMLGVTKIFPRMLLPSPSPSAGIH